MAFWPLTIEILITFVLSAFVLHRYGNWMNQNVITTVSVFIAWFFSFIVIFILPLDISTTTYNQCVHDLIGRNESNSLKKHWINSFGSNDTNSTSTTSTSSPLTPIIENECFEPWSYAPNQVLPTLWRIVYWTTQLLTWIVLPIMQSYSMAGEFTVGGKLKAAFVENAIYYGSFAIIFIIILIYVSIKTKLNLEGLKIICITASNTWGLFLLVVLLGYGLVEIPRTCFNTSQYARTISYLYFKVAKLSAEKCEADEKLEDVLEEIQTSFESLSGAHDPMKPYLDIIVDKCPPEWKQHLMSRLNQNNYNQGYSGSAYNEKSLTRMHKSIIKAMQMNHRTHCQWNLLISEAIEWEDVAKNEISPTHIYKSTLVTRQPSSQLSSLIRDTIYTPKIEWYWKCLVRGSVYRILGYLLTIFSLMVVWSEVTFSFQSIPLSIFALVMKIARIHYSYFFIEIFSIISIAYLCICSYYTVFKVRIFNYYYLAPYHQTDEYSLIFCGMLLCRLAPPLCLNFLGLIHLDSHITHKVNLEETAFTKIMGHLDVVSFIGDSFSIYLPICILLFCLATFFQFGSKILHNFGFEQFILTDEMTAELIREGQDLVKREKNKIIRQSEHKETPRTRNPIEMVDEHQPLSANNHKITFGKSFDEGVRQELINDIEPIDYSSNWNYNSTERPQKGLFDDI